MPENEQLSAAEEDQMDEELDHLLQKLYDEQGFDFRDYKKASLRRRIQKRPDELKISTYPGYERYLGTLVLCRDVTANTKRYKA